MRKPNTVLFLCTGNFYRSRFAEACFNHHAQLSDIGWRAISRGFRIHLAKEDLSHLAVERLNEISVSLGHTQAKPVKLEESDLDEADLVIALYEAEHRPMFEKLYPERSASVRYWQIPDIDYEEPQTALPRIEGKVERLIGNLRKAQRKVENVVFDGEF